jgi:hypothetical protein
MYSARIIKNCGAECPLHSLSAFRDHCSNVEHWLCKVRQKCSAVHINSGFSNVDTIFKKFYFSTFTLQEKIFVGLIILELDLIDAGIYEFTI